MRKSVPPSFSECELEMVVREEMLETKRHLEKCLEYYEKLIAETSRKMEKTGRANSTVSP